MKQIIIIGNGSYARMMNKYIKLTQFGEVCAFCVNKEYIFEDEIDNIPVFSFEELKMKYPCDKVVLIMGIGYTQMSNVRKRIFENCVEWGYVFENYIHPTAIISPDAVIGMGNNILERVIIEVGVTIGNGNLFFGGCIVGHETSIGNYNTFSVSVSTAGCVTINNNCFLGISSVVKDHVIVDDYALLGATAYAYKDIGKYAVVTSTKSEIIKDKISLDYL